MIIEAVTGSRRNIDSKVTEDKKRFIEALTGSGGKIDSKVTEDKKRFIEAGTGSGGKVNSTVLEYAQSTETRTKRGYSEAATKI